MRTNLPSVTAKPDSRPAATRPDQFSSESTARLKAALEHQPAVRADIVERARLLAADPGYPPKEVIQQVARIILAAPDQSQIES